MPLVVMARAKELFLDAVREWLIVVEGEIRISLYENDYTPTETDELADYTLVDQDGVSFIVLDEGWIAPVGPDPGVRWITEHPSVTFTLTSTPVDPIDVYGYVVYYNTGSQILWAERGADSITLISETDSVTVTPKLSSTTEFA